MCLIQILKWFSLKNGMVVLGLATSHHDLKIAGTFAQQLGWVFVGSCHPSAHGPPAEIRKLKKKQQKRFYFCSEVPHTHPRARARTHAYIRGLIHE
jgi:hypothetical protein